jgi:hypothetical protein
MTLEFERILMLLRISQTVEFVIETERAVSVDDDMLTPVVEDPSERTPTNADVVVERMECYDVVEGMDDRLSITDSEESTSDRHIAAAAGWLNYVKLTVMFKFCSS